MNITYESLHEGNERDCYAEITALIRKNPWTWQSVCAALGLACGVLAPILGALFDVASWFINSKAVTANLHILSIVLCALTIPLLIIGAVCLELLEAKSARPNSNHKFKRKDGLAALLLLLALPATGYAQQTVFNVPTTDVLEKGKVYVELDISAKPNDPKFTSFVPRGVVGAGGRVEVGLNVTGNIQPGVDATTLVPALKWKIYDNETNGWAIAVGNNLFIPVRNKSYDLGAYSYTMVQKTFKTKTRIGFGGYFFSKHIVAPNANRAGGQFTFEQPLTGRFGLQADWFTGKHASGYFTPGGYFKLNKKTTGYAAYSIGNANVTNGNHFLYFELGYNFN